MGQVYTAPSEIEEPQFEPIDTYQQRCEEYMVKLKNWCKLYSKDKYAGEILRIPQGDGYAQYMVLKLKPVKLIHIPLWDAWDSPFADQLSAKRIKEIIDGEKKLEKLFGKR